MSKTVEKISTEQKIEIIFSYLFDGKKSEEEEFFWNTLSTSELRELKEIEKEETMPFSSVSRHA